MRVGGFSPIFALYGQDDDLYFRVQFHGFEVGLVPASVIYHHRDFSTASRKQLVSDANKGVRMEVDQMVSRLMRPYGSLVARVLDWITDLLIEELRALRKRHFKRAGVLVVAAGKTALRMGEIRRQRALNRKPGPNWLTLEL